MKWKYSLMASLTGVAMAASLTAFASSTSPAEDSTYGQREATSTVVQMARFGHTDPFGGGNPFDPWQSSPGGAGSGNGGSVTIPSAPGTDNSTSSTVATDEESTGLVLINTEVNYGSGEAAGTGMVIDSDGIVVTNHHVVADSTTITVTVPSTGKTYDAEVLGYDATADVAVLHLEGASDLQTVTADTTLSVGQSVTAVGNAEGGGDLIAADGTVTATGASVTVSDEMTGEQATLTDLIEMDADLVAGDSGGAVLDIDGDVIGMNVAGSTDDRVNDSYAIPITTVLNVAESVLAGEATDTITIGRAAALGIEVSSQFDTVYVVGIFDGTAAAQAGITAGSTLTSIDGVDLSDSDALTSLLAQHKPGDTVSITWTDSAGSQHTATVTLGEGPLA